MNTVLGWFLDYLLILFALLILVVGIYGLSIDVGLNPFPRLQNSLPPLMIAILGRLDSELIGIGITVLIIDGLAKRQKRRKEDKKIKQDLLLRVRSQVNHIAVQALSELASNEWLYDGSLKEANLRGANLAKASFEDDHRGYVDLEGAYLQSSDLSFIRLHHSNLARTNFLRANLSYAKLNRADLKDAQLTQSNLSYANLFDANLTNAVLKDADLTDCSLRFANLQGVVGCTSEQLAKAKALRNAKMQNGTKYDGRFNLIGDLQAAEDKGIDIMNQADLANWYGVSIEAFRGGQEWLRENSHQIMNSRILDQNERNHQVPYLPE